MGKNPLTRTLQKDLSEIERRLDSKQYYITKDIFFADLRRMCENCMLYNKEDTVFYECAVTLQKFLADYCGAQYFTKSATQPMKPTD